MGIKDLEGECKTVRGSRIVFGLLVFGLALLTLWGPTAKGAVGEGTERPDIYQQQPCPDPYEPNDSFASAWYLMPGVIQSYVCSAHDMDYFKFRVRAGDLVRLELQNLPANYDLCLYDPGEGFLGCSQNAGTKPEAIEEVASSSGDYYARIYGVQGTYSPSEPYTFSIKRLPPTATPTPTPTPSPMPTCPDLYEPNETFASATLLSAGKYQAYICTPGDQDWFQIILLPLQELQVQLVDLPENYDLELYDPLGVRVTGSHNGGTTMEEINAVASVEGGAYRVRIRGVAGTSNPSQPYSLKLGPGPAPPAPTPTHTATPAPIPVCGHDPYEVNDSYGDAEPIDSGTEIHAYVCPEMDFDYYRFAVSGAVEIHARLYDLPQPYRLTLFDPSGWVVARGSGAGTEARELTHLPTVDGDYVLLVSPESPTAWDEDDAYSLEVSLNSLSPMTLLAVADSYVSQSDPASNFGDERHVLLGRDEAAQTYEYRGLFRFDLSSVPPIPIHSAVFRVSLYDASGGGMHDVDLLRVAAAWDEGMVTWSTQPWAVSTGVSGPIGTVANAYYQWDVTDLVQGWLTGGVGNFGLELRTRPGSSYRRFLDSKEWASSWLDGTGGGSSRSPKLTIHFTEPEPPPRPSGAINGTVYYDADRDGSYGHPDVPLPDVQVEFLQEWISQGYETTAVNGTYALSTAAGDYVAAVLESTLPREYQLSSSSRVPVRVEPGETSRADFRVVLRPTDPESTLDLTAEGIEFVQVLGGQALVAGKDTIARVYVGVTGSAGEVPGINANLYRRGHPDDPLRPIAPADLLPIADPMNDPDVVWSFEDGLNRTINFLLPDDWTVGDQEFYVWVNEYGPDLECPTCWNQKNLYYTWDHGTSPSFHEADPLNVTMVAVTVDGRTPSADPEGTYRFLQQIYPLNDVNADTDALEVSGYDFTRGCGTGWDSLLSDLEGMADLSSPDMHYYGMVDESVPHNVGADIALGCGRSSGIAAAGIVQGIWTQDGRIMAHEIGHNLGRSHTCGCTEPSCVDQHPGGIIGVYGVYPPNLVTFGTGFRHPDSTYDIMTYCDPQWISDMTYEALWDHFVLPAVPRAVQEADGAPQEYLVGSGHIVDGLVTMARPFYRLTYPAGTDDEPGEGPYALELQDATGTPLFTRYFDTVADSHDPSHGTGHFHQIVPWQAGTARIVIKEGQVVLLIIHVSAHPPKVILQSPNGGESWPPYGEHTVSWTGSDADGDPLRYALQYSPNGGNTWQAIAVNLVGESYTLKGGRLAGSETALLRVVASDGVNTSQDESDGAFNVEGKPPRAYILYPVDGSVVLPERLVVLEGIGTDSEDGRLTDPTLLTWSSSLEGELGVGHKLYFDDLLPGGHTITLRVADSEGFVSQDSVSILVGHQAYVPLVFKTGQ